MHNLVLWNFSSSPVNAEVTLTGLPRELRMRHVVLDAATPNSDENARLKPEPFSSVRKGNNTLQVQFEPYAIHYWSFE